MVCFSYKSHVLGFGTLHTAFSLVTLVACIVCVTQAWDDWVTRGLFIGLLIINVLTFLSGLLLLYGSLEDVPRYHSMWLVSHIVLPIYLVAAIIWAVVVIFGEDYATKSYREALPWTILGAGCYLIFLFPLIMAVYEHQRELRFTTSITRTSTSTMPYDNDASSI